MENTKVYIELSDEIQALLQKNRVSLERIIFEAGIQGEVSYEPLSDKDGVRSKDLVLTIIAAGAAVLAIGHAVSQIITTLHNKPHLIEVHELKPVFGPNDKPLTDATGQMIIRPVKRFELLEPAQHDGTQKLEISAGLTQGIVLKVRS